MTIPKLHLAEGANQTTLAPTSAPGSSFLHPDAHTLHVEMAIACTAVGILLVVLVLAYCSARLERRDITLTQCCCGTSEVKRAEMDTSSFVQMNSFSESITFGPADVGSPRDRGRRSTYNPPRNVNLAVIEEGEDTARSSASSLLQ